MKRQILIIGLLLFSTLIYSQNKVDSLVNIGIEYHDKGEYDKAIETYKAALKIDPKSALANYEIAMTYMYAKEYKKAIKHCDIVIKMNDKYLLPAYITKASSLNNLGKTEESRAMFIESIEKFGDNHLLYYNLALNYYKTKEYKEAEQAVINAIRTKTSHSGSHLLLGQMMFEQGLKSQSLLCLHYFLFLEPNTERSRTAYNLLQKQFNGNVKADKDKPNTFNININSIETETEFSHADLMISMLEATKTIEENENKSEDEMFIENTKLFFNILGELKKEDNKGLWWDYYIPFFDEIANSEHIDTYCYYISKSSNRRASDWLKENQDKQKEFATWLKEN